MALKKYIEANGVFSTEEYLSSAGDTQANRNLLSRAAKSGRVKKVRRGIYVSNVGKWKDVSPNPFSLVLAIDPEAVFCYETAFSLFVGSHNITNRTSFYSKKQIDNFDFEDREFIVYKTPEKGVTQKTYNVGELFVSGTTKEQTIVDSLKRPGRCGGIENVLRLISTVTYIDVRALENLLNSSSKATKARAGWVLEQKQEEWDIDQSFLDKLSDSLGDGVNYFSTQNHRHPHAYDSKWKLYFPEPISTVEEWVNG